MLHHRRTATARVTAMTAEAAQRTTPGARWAVNCRKPQQNAVMVTDS